VARVELAQTAVEDLERLLSTLTLPVDARARVQRSLRVLEQFPLLGQQLTGRWDGLRFIVGPWRWLLIVYQVAAADRVVVVGVHDTRSAQAPTA
jgi:plasmid stabilization system protein ParE